MKADARKLKLLLIKPPAGWNYNQDARETIRKLARDVAAILRGTQIVTLPDGWNSSVIEVDGIAVDVEK